MNGYGCRESVVCGAERINLVAVPPDHPAEE